MNSLLERLRGWFGSGAGKTVGATWPISRFVNRLNCWHEADTAKLLLFKLAELDEQCRGDKYARISETGIEKAQRAIKSLRGELKEANRKNVSGTLTPVQRFELKYNSLRQQIETVLQQDRKWRTRGENLRTERTELWERVVKWAPKWQLTVKAFITETDEALKVAPRAKSPDAQMQLAARAVSRLQNALEYVDEVNRLNSRATQVARRIEVLKPIAGSYVSEDALSFRATLSAGQQAFTAGEYVAARRHLDAALQLAKRVAASNREERMKRKAEAQQWKELLPDPGISAEITNVLGHWSSPEFAHEWEELHKKIDDLVLAKACDMGNRDQKIIAKRIGAKRTVRWREHMEWADLERFARATVYEL
jgi:hypothetical protein